MASNTKDKGSRSQPTRLSKNAPCTPSLNKQAPNTATYNPRTATSRYSYRGCASQLPVPVVNKTSVRKAKRKPSAVRKTDNAASHPNLTKLLASQPQPALPPNPSNNNVTTTTDASPKFADQDPSGKSDDTSPPSLSLSADHTIHELPSCTEDLNATVVPSGSLHISDQQSNFNTTQENPSQASPSNDSLSASPPDKPVILPHDGPPAPTGESNAVSNTNETLKRTEIEDLATHSSDHNQPHSLASSPWQLVYSEMKSMRLEMTSMSKRLSQLDKIERDVGSLKSQIDGISSKTRDLERALKDHSTDIDSLKTSLSETTSKINDYDSSIEKLWAYTDEIASKADQRVRELKEAVQENIDRIGQIGDVKATIKKEVEFQIKEVLQVFKQEFKKECGEQIRRSSQSTKNELHQSINRTAHYFAYKSLQDQAFFNRHNLVIRGIQEHETDSAFSQAANFFKTSLNLSRISIDVAYRLGKPPSQGSSYVRPIVVKFSKISDRNTVWKKRNVIPQQGRGKTIRIQADIPKQLREDLHILYRVHNAAQKTNQYQSIEVKNYRLYLDGAEFFAWELEELPVSLRPSTLATRVSNNALVFYSKHSALSNHHPSPFEVRGRSFANMEQYLAYKKAKLSGQKTLIQKALLAQDPVEAKSVNTDASSFTGTSNFTGSYSPSSTKCEQQFTKINW